MQNLSTLQSLSKILLLDRSGRPTGALNLSANSQRHERCLHTRRLRHKLTVIKTPTTEKQVDESKEAEESKEEASDAAAALDIVQVSAQTRHARFLERRRNAHYSAVDDFIEFRRQSDESNAAAFDETVLLHAKTIHATEAALTEWQQHIVETAAAAGTTQADMTALIQQHTLLHAKYVEEITILSAQLSKLITTNHDRIGSRFYQLLVKLDDIAHVLRPDIEIECAPTQDDINKRYTQNQHYVGQLINICKQHKKHFINHNE